MIINMIINMIIKKSMYISENEKETYIFKIF